MAVNVVLTRKFFDADLQFIIAAGEKTVTLKKTITK